MSKMTINLTLDPAVIEAIRAKAAQLSQQTGVKISTSAAANALLHSAISMEQSEKTSGNWVAIDSKTADSA